MKIVATQDGIAFVLTQMEQQRLTTYSKDTDYTPRQVLECMAEIHSSNFDEDVKSAIESLDDDPLEAEAASV